MDELIGRLSQEFHVRPEHAQAVVELLDEGNTVPFIARYRERAPWSHGRPDHPGTGGPAGLFAGAGGPEEGGQSRCGGAGQADPGAGGGPWTGQPLWRKWKTCTAPYRPKRRTRASTAREKGLEPLAQLLLKGKDKQGRPLSQTPEKLAQPYVDAEKGVATVEEALQGAKDILAGRLFRRPPPSRKGLRAMLQKNGSLRSVAAKEEDSVYQLVLRFHRAH